MNNIHLRHAVTFGRGSFIAKHVRRNAWAEHRATLALLVDDQTWSCIEHYYLVLDQLIQLMTIQGSLGESLNEKNLTSIYLAQERGSEGRQALRALAGRDVTIVISSKKKPSGQESSSSARAPV